MTIKIVELYRDYLAVNGDVGNVFVLARRMRLAGIDVEEIQVNEGDDLPEGADIVTIGSGPGSAVRAIAPELQRHAETLQSWAAAGVPMIAVGGGFHLFGRTVSFGEAGTVQGAGVFPMDTDANVARVRTDAFAADSNYGLLVGTENHSSESVIDGGTAVPLGTVRNGRGNRVAPNGARHEGFVVNEAIGTHLGGPVLVLNPRLTDHIIEVATTRRGETYTKNAEHESIDRVVDLARTVLIDKANLG